MKETVPTAEQTAFDPLAKRYVAGDVSLTKLDLILAGSQQGYRAQFEQTLGEHGVKVIKSMDLHQEYGFVVDASQAAPGYEKKVTSRWTFATLDPKDGNWYLPYLKGVEPSTIHRVSVWLQERSEQLLLCLGVSVGAGVIFYDQICERFF